MDPTVATDRSAGRDFIRRIIDRHLEEGRYEGVITRFPPEPNGYLHLGHAKSIVLNFGIAEEYRGRCHLRYDDTNPLTEDEEYTRSMQADIRWLGYDWGEHLYHASDYFERMYDVACDLIRQGKAYVDTATEDEIRDARGTVTSPGRPTPDRDRAPEESLDLFRRMRDGEFADGAMVLRGRIDLASPNMIMRDPIFYRIRHARHYRTGDRWCIYPLYDFAHCLEDAFEGITHSLCTMEFENNREIYDWILDHAGFTEPRPHQYEFARLSVDYTIMSKRRLIRLVEEGHVSGWDDPRMPTIAGLRRRGVPPEAVRRFCRAAGVTRSNTSLDPSALDFQIRDVLNPVAPRALGVVRPLRVVLTDWPEGHREVLEAPLHPDAPDSSTRMVPMSEGLWIDAEDFRMDPPPGWKRLAPGREVRLRHGYVIRCHAVIEAPDGRTMTLHCTHDRETLGRNPDRPIGGAIHWVPAAEAVPAEFRLHDRLFRVPEPGAGEGETDFLDDLNPASLEVTHGFVEPALRDRVRAELAAGTAPHDIRVQLERVGYFTVDPDGADGRLVFNRIVALRDGWKAGTDDARTPSASAPPEGEPVIVYQTDADRIADERREAREQDPELAARFERYRDEHGLSVQQADLLTADRAMVDFYEAAVDEAESWSEVAAWVVNDLQALLPDDGVAGIATTGAMLGRLVARVREGRVSRRAAKEVLAEMVRRGGDPDAIIAREGWTLLDDAGALEEVVRDVLAAWPEKVAEYRAGHTNLIGLFMGQVMKKTDGRAEPAAARREITRQLDAHDG